MYQNKVLNQISTKLPKFFSVRELKIKDISHTKGHYGQRSLNKKIQKERHAGGLKRKDKSRKPQKVKNGMGMRNKWIYLFTICYDPVVLELETTKKTEVKRISFSWP